MIEIPKSTREARILMAVGLAAFLCSVYPVLGAATQPPLGAKLPQFAVLAGAAVTGSAGAGTTVNGDVGSGLGTVISFPPSSVVLPFIKHAAADADVVQALIDARAAWNDMGTQGAGVGAIALIPELNGATLGPGVYNFAAAANLLGGGTLTLNDPTGTGIFIFNVGSSLTANVGSTVVGTANPCNVYWRMGTNGSATLNGNNFWGTVIADQSVTVSSANNLTGRAVGIVAAVTMPAAGGNIIGGCSVAAVVCPPPAAITVNTALPGGNVGTFYTQTITASGGTGPYTFVVTGTLPPGLTLSGGILSGTPTTTGTFNFTITPTDANLCGGTGRAYAMVIAAAGVLPGGGVGGPTLDSFGLAVLLALLAVAGLFAVNRFTS